MGFFALGGYMTGIWLMYARTEEIVVQAMAGSPILPEDVRGQIVRADIGRKFQRPTVSEDQTVSENLLLAREPRLLLLDEPAAGIQPNIIQQIGRVIEYLKAKGNMAIVLVEQYFDFAFDLGDHFYVLKRGEVNLTHPKDGLTREALQAALSI